MNTLTRLQGVNNESGLGTDLLGIFGVEAGESSGLVMVEDSGLGFVTAVRGWWDWVRAPAAVCSWVASESNSELSSCGFDKLAEYIRENRTKGERFE